MDKKKTIKADYDLYKKRLRVKTEEPGDLIKKSKQQIKSKTLSQKERVSIMGLV